MHKRFIAALAALFVIAKTLEAIQMSVETKMDK